MEGHSACIMGASLFLYGGKKEESIDSCKYSNEVLMIPNIANFLLSQPDAFEIKLLYTMAPPQGRAYHTACAFKEKYMIVFGGMMGNIHDQRQSMRMIDILDVEQGRWHKATAKGDEPTSRLHYAWTVSKESVYVHGGYPLFTDAKGNMKEFTSREMLNMGDSFFDTYVLNIETMMWRRVNSPNSPKPMLWGHAAVSLVNNIVVFGGVDVSKSTEIGDVVLWNTQKNIWQWTNCSCFLPSAMHQAVAIRQGSSLAPTHLIVFGGVKFSSHERVLELRQFDLHKGEWSVLSTQGDIPSGRIGHVMLPYMSDNLLLIGGVQAGLKQDWSLYILDMPSKNWKRTVLQKSSKGMQQPQQSNLKPYTGENDVATDVYTKQNDLFRAGSELKNDDMNYHFSDEAEHVRKDRETLHEALSADGVHYTDNYEKANFNSGFYDAPPPLPPSHYSNKYQSFPQRIPPTATFSPKNPSSHPNLRSQDMLYPSNKGPSSDTFEKSEDAIFEELGPLLNVSDFSGLEEEGNGTKNGIMHGQGDPGQVTSSSFSSHLLKKMINSALHREDTDDLPEHIANCNPTEDPFSYLRPTASVRRWRHENIP